MRDKSNVSTGLSLALKHHRLIWWFLVVSFVLCWLASMPLRSALSTILDHSLAADKLVTRFDIPTFVELISAPERTLGAMTTGMVLPAVVFFVYMLFVSGGIIEVFREDRKLSKAEFFEYSGAFFWRNVRLMLISIIPFGIVIAIWSAINGWTDSITDASTNPRAGFNVLMIISVVLLLVFLWVRAWFDVAQVRAVSLNERGMLRNSWRSLVIAARNAPRLIGSYLLITVVGFAVTCLMVWIWLNLPHARIGLALLVLEIGLVAQFLIRLWQKATVTAFYERNFAEHYVAAPTLVVPQTEPILVETKTTPTPIDPHGEMEEPRA